MKMVRHNLIIILNLKIREGENRDQKFRVNANFSKKFEKKKLIALIC